jgi:hypothetical protein
LRGRMVVSPQTILTEKRLTWLAAARVWQSHSAQLTICATIQSMLQKREIQCQEFALALKNWMNQSGEMQRNRISRNIQWLLT